MSISDWISDVCSSDLVREAERKRQYYEYKDRVGEVVNGIVKRNEFGNVTVDLGRAEALMRRDESLPRESFRTGDRVRAYIYDVREERSEEHTSELQSLMRNTYAVFCLNKKH